MTYLEAKQVFERMKLSERFNELHVLRTRAEINDQEFLKELDKLQIRAESVLETMEEKNTMDNLCGN